MKVESLSLRNFQVHKFLRLDLSPTITTIVGPTDSGKSAILRGLRWALLNDLAGDDFIREGEDNTVVIVRTSDNHKIGRGKGKDGNIYRMDDMEAFKAFGQDVPEPIKHFLQVSEVNFQGQHDSPFWFSETAGEVSRQLNSIIDLGIIDTALANISTRLRSANERHDVCTERLKQIEDDLERLTLQRLRIAQFERLKAAQKELAEASSRHAVFNGFIEMLENYVRRYKTEQDRLEATEALLETAETARSAARHCVNLTSIVRSLESLKQVVEPPDFVPVEKAWNKYQIINEQVDAFASTIDALSLSITNALSLSKAAQQAEKEFHEATKDETCPLCGNPM